MSNGGELAYKAATFQRVAENTLEYPGILGNRCYRSAMRPTENTENPRDQMSKKASNSSNLAHSVYRCRDCGHDHSRQYVDEYYASGKPDEPSCAVCGHYNAVLLQWVS